MSNYLVTDEAFLRIKAAHKLHKMLQKEKTIYQQQALRRCGVGLTVPEFDEIVQATVSSGWCTAKAGPNGGVLLTFAEAFNDVHLPEEAERITVTVPEAQ
jgi:hypothetical protein